MAKTKQQLKVENNTQFPNNNSNFITPSRLRSFNTDMIDSLVDEISYGAYTASITADSASFDARINALSGSDTGSLLVTASAAGATITFTKGDQTTFDVTVSGAVTDTGSLVTTASFNSYTASTDGRLTNLEATTASLNTSVANLNSFTASQTTLNGTFATTGSNSFNGNQTITGSLTASLQEGYVWVGNSAGVTTTVATSSFGGGGSTDTGSFATTGSNSFVGNQFINGTLSVTSSIEVLSGSFSGSVITNITDTYTDVAEVDYVVTLTSASYAALVTSSATNDNTLYIVTNDDGYVDFGTFNSFTASVDGRLDSLESNTGSYATTGSNIFIGNQTITGSVRLAQTNAKIEFGSTSSFIEQDGSGLFIEDTQQVTITSPTIQVNGTLDADLTEGHAWVGNSSGKTVAVPTSSFGGGGTGTGFPFTGSAQISGSLGITGSISFGVENFYVSGANSGSFISNITDTYTSSAAIKYITTLDSSSYAALASGSTFSADTLYVVSGALSIPSYTEGDVLISGSFTASLQEGYAWVGNSAGISAAVPTSSFGGGGSTSTGSLLVTASAAGNTITFTKGDQTTFDVTLSGTSIDTASFATTGSNTFVGNQTISGSVRLSQANAKIEFGSTSSFIEQDGSALFIEDTQQVSITSPTIQLNGTLDADLTEGNVWVGNSSGKTVAVPTSSLVVDTSGLATTGSNTFVGNQTISGSATVKVDAGEFSVISGSTKVLSVTGSDVIVTANTEIKGNLVVRDPGDTDNVTLTVGGNEVFTIANGTAGTFFEADSGGNIALSQNLTVVNGINASGSVDISGSFKINSLNYPTASGVDGYFLQTNGTTQADWNYVKTLYEDVKNGNGTTLPKGTPVFASGSVGNQSIVIAADAGDPTRMPATYVLAQELAPDAEGLGIVIGFINGVDTSAFTEGDVIYVGVGGGYTNVPPTGSALIQPLGIVNKVDASNGSGVVLNPGVSNGLPNIAEGNAWVGNVDGVPTAVATSSFGGGTSIDTGSFATTGSNTFVGNQTITGSLTITGSAYGNVTNVTVSSSTGSFNLSSDNFFTVTLPTGSTYFDITNIGAGQTVNILVNTNTANTASFSPNVKQATGSFYTPSASGSQDVLTLISWNTSSVYLAHVKGMV